MINILTFKGKRRNTNNIKPYSAVVEVCKDGKTRDIWLPAHASSIAMAISKGRKWRNTEGNMARLEQAFDDGLHEVPSNRTKP